MTEVQAPPKKEIATIDAKDYEDAFQFMGLNEVVGQGITLHKQKDKPTTRTKGRANLEWIGLVQTLKDTDGEVLKIATNSGSDGEIPRLMISKDEESGTTHVEAAMLIGPNGAINPDVAANGYKIKTIQTVEGKVVYTVTRTVNGTEEEQHVTVPNDEAAKAFLYANRKVISSELKPEDHPLGAAFMQSLDTGASAIVANKTMQENIEKEAAERYISGRSAYRFVDAQIEDIEAQIEKLSKKEEPKKKLDADGNEEEGDEDENKDEDESPKIDPAKEKEKQRLEELRDRLIIIRDRFKTESGDLKLIASPTDLAEAMTVVSEQDMAYLREQLKQLEGKVPAEQLQAIATLVNNPRPTFEAYFKAMQNGNHAEFAKSLEACLETGDTNKIKEQVLNYLKTQTANAQEAEEIAKKFWETSGGKGVITVILIALGLTLPAFTAALSTRGR